MVSVSDLRTGLTIEIDNDVYSVVEFQHVKPGKGAAFVRTKLKNVKTGGVVEKTFNAGEKVPKAHVDRREMQYLYNDGVSYTFMDNASYEQMELSKEQLGDTLKWIKENMSIHILLYQGKSIGIEPPTFVELEVVETAPGIKGDTASGGTKPAKVETGAVVNVPFFVNVGDKLQIDTRNGSYLKRV
jgi:elongation factor P